MVRRAPANVVARAIRHNRTHLLRGTALQAVTALVFIGQAAAQPSPNARPTGGTVVSGTANISQSARTTTINQSTDRAAIDWRSFNVGSQQSVQFNQPSASSWTLNRVTGPDPSQIAGKISANGGIMLTNPSGVMFYRGAQVNAANLVVSAAGITNQNFNAGKMVFDQAPKPNAAIVNDGTITVKQAGLAALVAPRVANSGVINARLGRAVLAGAETHTLDLYGDGLVSIDVGGAVKQVPVGRDGKPVTALVTNTGTVIADGGVVQITARAADGIVQNLVDAGGRIQANSVGGQTGTVLISGVGGSVQVAGRIAADGGKNATGGQIAVTASDTVAVGSGARISANGGTGGGTVALGTTIARAQAGRVAALTHGAAPGLSGAVARRVTVAAGATVTANARNKGDGGTVTALAKEHTTVAGHLAARGGKNGGNGGVAEVSGATASFTGTSDTRAPAGHAGTFYLDPNDVVIADSNGTITPAAVNEISLTQDVDLAGNNITVVNDVTVGNSSRASSLTLDATAQLRVDNGVQIRAFGDIFLNSSGQSVTLGNSSQLIADGGIKITAAQSIDIGDGAILRGGPNPSNPRVLGSSQTQITLNAGTELSVGGPEAAAGPAVIQLLTTQGVSIDPTISLTSGTRIALNRANIGTTDATLNINAGTFLLFDCTAIGCTVGPDGFAPSATDELFGSDVTIQAHGASPAGNDISFGLGSRITAAGTLSIATSATGKLVSGADITQTIASGSPSEPAFSLTAGSASFAAGHTIAMTGVSSIATAGDLNAAGTIAEFASADGTASLSIASSGGAITLASTSNVSGAGPVSILASGALTAAGTISDLPSATTPASLTLQSTTRTVTLPKGTNVTGGGTVTITAQGDLVSDGDISNFSPSAATDTLSLTSSGGAVTLQADGALVSNTPIVLTSDGNLSISGTVNSTQSSDLSRAGITGSTTNGTITVTSGSTVTALEQVFLEATRRNPQPPPTSMATVHGDVNGSVIIISAGAGGISLGGNLTATDASAGAAVVLRGVLDENASTFQSPTTFGQINQTGGVIKTPSLVARGTSVSLTGANDIDTLASNATPRFNSLASSGDFVLNNAAALNVAGSITANAGNVTVTAPDLTVNGAITAGGGQKLLTLGGNTIALNAGASLSNTGGTIVLQPLGDNKTLSLTDNLPAAGLSAATLQIGSANGGDTTINGAVELDGSGSTINLLSGGVVDEAIGASLTASNLTGNVGNANLAMSGNKIGTLGDFTSRGGLVFADSSALFVGGKVQAGGGGNALLLASDAITLQATASLTNTGGTVSLGPLSSGQPASITSNLTSGGVSANTLRLGALMGGDTTIKGNFNLNGNVTTIDLASSGAVNEDAAASLQATQLTGNVGSASLNGKNQFSQLGAFTSGGNFVFTDTGALTVTGPVLAGGQLSITDAGSTLTLQGGTLTGNAVQLRADGGSIVQTGSTTIAQASGGSGTLLLGAQGGQITLHNLIAGSMATTLDLGTGGTASGTIALQSLQVSGSGGSATLSGTVNGQAGAAAASISTITPGLNTNYVLNGCAISATTCGGTQPQPPQPPQQPQQPTPALPLYFAEAAFTPKSFLDTTLGSVFKPYLFTVDLITIGIVHDQTDPDLVLPNISDRDY